MLLTQTQSKPKLAKHIKVIKTYKPTIKQRKVKSQSWNIYLNTRTL